MKKKRMADKMVNKSLYFIRSFLHNYMKHLILLLSDIAFKLAKYAKYKHIFAKYKFKLLHKKGLQNSASLQSSPYRK